MFFLKNMKTRGGVVPRANSKGSFAWSDTIDVFMLIFERAFYLFY
jgi:hypothetical protein